MWSGCSRIKGVIAKQVRIYGGDCHGKKEKRFEVIFKDGSELKEEGVRQILVDKETGVHYLLWKSGYGAGITPLLDSEGKITVEKIN